jgi:hypothetical protein
MSVWIAKPGPIRMQLELRFAKLVRQGNSELLKISPLDAQVVHRVHILWELQLVVRCASKENIKMPLSQLLVKYVLKGFVHRLKLFTHRLALHVPALARALPSWV